MRTLLAGHGGWDDTGERGRDSESLLQMAQCRDTWFGAGLQKFPNSSSSVELSGKVGYADWCGEKDKSSVKENKTWERVSKSNRMLKGQLPGEGEPQCWPFFNRCSCTRIWTYHACCTRCKLKVIIYYIAVNDIKHDMSSEVEMEVILTLIITYRHLTTQSYSLGAPFLWTRWCSKVHHGQCVRGRAFWSFHGRAHLPYL